MPHNVTIATATFEEIPAIIEIAEKTWWPSYSSILSDDQLRYMLATIFNTAALKESMDEGSQQFILLSEHGRPQGFASYGRRPEADNLFKLHKLYVLPENQGKGFGKMLVEEVIKRVKREGLRTLDLNVNRYNPAKRFYERLGFRVLREEDIPIGPYWMNDYVMRVEF